MKLWKVLNRQMNSKNYNLKHKKDNIFNIDFKVNKLSKVKFTNMIYPNTKVDIEGHYLNDSLTFKIYDNDKKYSEGRANITLL